MLHPKIATNHSQRDAFPSILPLVMALPRLTSSCNIQEIDDECRRLPITHIADEISQTVEPDLFWFKLGNYKNVLDEVEFKVLPQFALDALLIPHSNADCERIFSKINRMLKLQLETN